MHITKRESVFVFLLLALAGCGGGGGGGETTGRVSLLLTDARSAFEDVSKVVVQFTGVTLKPQNGDEIFIDFSTNAPPNDLKTIDLMTLTNGAVAALVDGVELPAGSYNWVRLHVNARFDTEFDSYAEKTDGTQVELQVPSGEQAGLRLVSGFTVMAGGTTHLVIDWDLRKALVEPQGAVNGQVDPRGYFLRPALRITDMAEFGNLFGTVDPLLLSTEPGAEPACTNDLAMDTGSAVYVYEGSFEGTPGDIGDLENPEPLVTATVTQNGDGIYTYEVHFLPLGDYTAAFTCQAGDDGADSDDAIWFRATETFAIGADGVDAVVPFGPPAQN
ncbi:MAG: DUF4382 domain-containing protein [Gammaproteobacteria bacterium]|nr:DUF4382 domain-containing protein [Gammaproteobacteria bacterium]MDH5310292.1 DUF4382 domain-containing protein [Gammaproteobacteria bacterium]